MRKVIWVITFVFLAGNLFAQHYNLSNIVNENPLSKKTTSNYMVPLIMLNPFNPIVSVENKKVYFGFTKQVELLIPINIGIRKGIAIQPGLEYSYLFRKEYPSQIRAFLDIGYLLESGDFVLFFWNVGGGYFTDTRKAGISAQTSLSILLPLLDNVSFNVYLKARNTFMLKKEEANIFDTSLGFGIVFNL